MGICTGNGRTETPQGLGNDVMANTVMCGMLNINGNVHDLLDFDLQLKG